MKDQAETLRHYCCDKKADRRNVLRKLRGTALRMPSTVWPRSMPRQESFKKGEAIVKLGADIPEEELREAVEKLGYKVTSIEMV